MNIKYLLSAVIILAVPGLVIISGKMDNKNFISEKIVEETSSIGMGTGSDDFLLIKENGAWMLVSENLKIKCRQEMVSSFLDSLDSLCIKEVAGETKEVWKDLGVDRGACVYTSLTGKHGSFKIIWGKRTFGGKRIFVRKGNGIKTFVVDFPGDYIYSDRWKWVSLKLFPETIDLNDLLSISFFRNDDAYRIERKEKWELISRYGVARLDRKKTEALIYRIINIRGDSIESGERFKSLRNEGTVKIHMSDGNEYQLDFYKKNNELFVKNSDNGHLFRIGKAQVNAVLPDLKYLIDTF